MLQNAVRVDSDPLVPKLNPRGDKAMASNTKKRRTVQKAKLTKSGKNRKRAERKEIRLAREKKVDVL